MSANPAMPPSPKKILCFGYGNPGRGDDALGPELINYIETQELKNVECICDMQLQVEDITELTGREKIIFIDADMSCEAPFQYSQISARKDCSYTSHAMTPEALLYAYWKTYGKEAPPAYMLRIRGYQFELGESLSTAAEVNLGEVRKLLRIWGSDMNSLFINNKIKD
ncbi:MAG: hydrogenase maturation protease [Gammaproteobacteria bacterium]|nr:hydrogenase maturation protease [Gammaproteobacteria bacterium]